MLQKYSLNSVSMAAVCAAAIFVLFFLIFLIGSDYGFMAAFFMSLVIAVLSGIIIYLLFGHKVTGVAPSAGQVEGHTADVAAADRTDAAEDEAAAAARKKADAEAEAARKAAEAAETAEAKKRAEEEAAKQAEAAPAQSAPAAAVETTPDYDGDGTREGTEEGTRPAGLDAPKDGAADDLKQIKGVGPKLEKLLNSMGFWHFDQIAAWSEDEVAWVNANLTGFKGRVSRDNWIEQAKTLASGGETEFSKRVEDGDVY